MFPVLLRGAVAVEHPQLDAGSSDLAALVDDVFTLARTQPCEKIVKAAVVCIVPVELDIVAARQPPALSPDTVLEPAICATYEASPNRRTMVCQARPKTNGRLHR